MKKVLIVLALVVVVVLGYFGRHKIKAILMGTTSPQPTTENTTNNVVSNNIYATKTDAKKGSYLADFQGMTLYTFDKDSSGVSNCKGACATLWPPYTSGATAQSQFPANITVITRADGTKQFAWMGKPLYYYSKDKAAGDLTGDGFNGVWHIVKAVN